MSACNFFTLVHFAQILTVCFSYEEEVARLSNPKFIFVSIWRNFQNCAPYLVPKSQKNFLMNPRTMFKLWTCKNKKIFLAKCNFSFFALFLPFLNSTQSEFGRYKIEFKHCTPPIMVSLASSTLTVPILIPEWDQNTPKERQDLHIHKYPPFHPLFLALFLHFFSITCCKWIF